MKTTKRALFSSVIALILCFSMLVGTTFAWFTDSVESGVNQIIAGNLDIELYHEDNQVTNTYDKLFEDILWEPGVVAYENITVKNEGTLQLKYQLSVNFDNATPAKNGKTLADALYVAFVEGGFSGDREYAKTLDFAPMASFMQAGQLNVTDHTSDTYGIVIYWLPTDKDNDFNMNNENRDEELSINLGIKLVATQVEGEFDSFGPDYDVDAIYTDAVVTSEEELKEALANAKDYAIIGIKGNVTWETGAGIGSTPFIENASTYSAKSPVKNITLLGLEEGATFTATGKGVGAIGIDGGTVTFKNLKIVDESVSYAEGNWEYGYLEFRGNTVFENCDIVNAIMMEGDSATFKNCTFNSRKDSEYAVWVSEGDATFENCYITGARGIKVHEAYGSKVGTVVIKNNQFIDLTEKPGLAIGDVDAETTVVLQNNTFAGTQAGDQDNYMYETDTAVTTFDFVCADNIVAGYADTNADLKAQLQNKATVILPEGEYSLPTLSGKEGITIIGAADGSTVIGGENTSTGFGDNFGKNTTIKNVTFSGASNGVRSSYAQGGTTIFENCTFAGDSTYGFHIDESKGATFIFKNCTFIGFNAFAGDLEKVVFENCTFLHNGNYGHTNIWSVAEFNNCTWGEGATYGTRGDGVIYIDGVRVVATSEALNAAVKTNAVISLVPGEYELTATAIGATIKGASEETVRINAAVPIYGFNGKIPVRMHFENLTFTNTMSTFQDTATEETGGTASTFTNVTFEAGFRHGYGSKVVFTDCTFGSNTEGYALHFEYDEVGTAGEIKLTGCKFLGGKVHLGGPRTYAFTNCDFATGTDFQVWTGVTLNGCTVNGVAVTTENISTLFPNLDINQVTVK